MGSQRIGEVVLEATGVSVRFGAVQALLDLDFQVRAGEVVALVGDNGAGKSTLIKVLSGVLQPDEGMLQHRGKHVTLSDPSEARARGIETIYQDLALIGSLDIASNLFLGRERRLGGLLAPLRIADDQSMAQRTQEHLADLGLHLPNVLRLPARSMSGGQRQAVAIARASAWASDVLIMDEPTAALGVAQSNAVLRLVKRIAERGVGVVLISHTMPHVMAVADRVVVLRRGAKVADLARPDVTPDLLVSLIVGFDPDSPDVQELVI
ncbi:MAG: ATP-binding cassette domain-containing protein [Nocardioides sp.]|uniref:ATP-binding cassette domain-containing protein n=1 Tax=Nocardioides sp. TaxID=35761 RepID=UPI0039E6043D